MASDVTLTLKGDNSDLVKKLKEVQKEEQKVYDTAEKGTKREKGLIQDIETELEKLYASRKKAYSIEDIEKHNKKIAEAKKDLEEYEKAGLKATKQTESMTQAIGKWVLGLGLAATVLNKLKDAFLQTTQGINIFNIAGAAMNQVLSNIVNGVGQWNQGVAQAIALQKELNDIRVRNYADDLRVKVLMKEYNKLYTEGIDHTITSEEKIKKLTEAKKKYIEAVNIEIASTKELFINAKKQWEANPTNEKALQRMLELAGKVQDLEGELESGTRRLVALITNEVHQAAETWRKELQSISDGLDKLVDEYLKEQYLMGLKRKNQPGEAGSLLGLVMFGEDDVEIIKKVKDFKEKAELELSKLAKSSAKWYKVGKDAELDREEEVERKKLALKKQTWQTIIDGEQMIFDLLSNRVNNNYNLELNALEKTTDAKIKAAGDDEKQILSIQNLAELQRLEIEKKYRKEQQKIAIAQATISGAQAIIKTFAEYGFTPAAWLANALLAVSTAIQIGVIKSQKFAKGGWTGDGSQRDETGERVAGIVHEKEFVVRKGPAYRFREVLEAINKEDRGLIVNRFNKIIPELSPVNNITVENNGSNNRLDRVNNKLSLISKQLEPKKETKEQVLNTDKGLVYHKGNSTRIVR